MKSIKEKAEENCIKYGNLGNVAYQEFVAGANYVLELNGERHTISEWSRITGFRAGTLQNRKYAGWSDEKTLTYPLRKHKKYKIKMN